MGQLVPVLVAYLLLCFGIQYFREPREVGNGPLVSSYIFMFAAFLLLWDIRLYPKSLRRLGIISQAIVEFLIASFLFENIMVDFWFPLEVVVLASPAKLADGLEEMLQTGDWSCDGVCEFLRDETTSFAVSYILSIFFVLAVLHSTRAIDLRLLECGPQYFISDIVTRGKRFLRRQKRYLGIGVKKKVHIKECGSRRGRSASRLSLDSMFSFGRRKGRSSSKRSKSRCKSPCDNELKYSFSDFEMDLND